MILLHCYTTTGHAVHAGHSFARKTMAGAIRFAVAESRLGGGIVFLLQEDGWPRVWKGGEEVPMKRCKQNNP